MIPKRIFYVWGVHDPKRRDVLACMQTWRQNCPDYEIIEINENSVEYFNFQEELKNNKWFRTVYERKMWAYVSDYIRIKVLHDHGGVYLDTDVSVLKNFDAFLDHPAFVGMQDSATDGHADYVEPAILGAEKGNKFLHDICEFYNDLIWTLPIYTMPEIFYHFCQKRSCPAFGAREEEKIINLEDIVIYPERYFIPFRYQKGYTPDCITADTYTIHWFNGSWVKPEILYFLERKHLYQNFDDSAKFEKYDRIKLFNWLDICKIVFEENDNKVQKTYKLLDFLPILSIVKEKNKEKICLFGFLPLFCFKIKSDKIKCSLFGFVPLWSVKGHYNV